MDEYELHIMVGIPGSGKTTLAKRLAKELDAPHISYDSIHMAMGWQLEEVGHSMIVSIMQVVAKSMFINGSRAVIIDDCNPSRASRDRWKCDRAKRIFHVVGSVSQKDLTQCRINAKSRYPLINNQSFIDKTAKAWEEPDNAEGTIIRHPVYRTDIGMI